MMMMLILVTLMTWCMSRQFQWTTRDPLRTAASIGTSRSCARSHRERPDESPLPTRCLCHSSRVSVNQPTFPLPMTEFVKYDRRAFMAYFSSIGLGSTLFPGVLWGQMQQQPQAPEITKEMIAAAEQIADVSFTDDERTAIVRNLHQARNAVDQLHRAPLDMSVFPAIVFDPVPPGEVLPPKTKASVVRSRIPVMSRPGSLEELAYASVAQLSTLVRARKVKSAEL